MAGYVHGANGRRWVVVAIANHRRAAAIRPASEALIEWAAQALSEPSPTRLPS